MNSFILFVLVLVVVNGAVFFLAKLNWFVWIIASVVLILSSPVVFVLTMNNVGHNVGDGIAGAVAGLTFGGLLLINAIILLIIAAFRRKKRKQASF